MGCVSSTNKHKDACVGTDDYHDDVICLDVHSKALKNKYYDQVNIKTSKHTSTPHKQSRSNTSVITYSLKSPSSHQPKKSKGFDDKSPSSSKACSAIINNRCFNASVKSEISSPKMNASAEIIAGPIITSAKGEDNFKKFDLDYLENKPFPSNPYLPVYQERTHENIQGMACSPQSNYNQEMLRRYYSPPSTLTRQRSAERLKGLITIPEHSSLQHESSPSTSGSSSSPGFVPSISQSHELTCEPLRLAPDIENEDLVELSYIRSAVEWRNKHKGKVNMETQLRKRRVEMVCDGAFLQFNEKALKYEIICIDSSLPGLRMSSSESEKSNENKVATISKPYPNLVSSRTSDETNEEPKSSSNHLSKDSSNSSPRLSSNSSNELTRKSSEGKMKEVPSASTNTSDENKDSYSPSSHISELHPGGSSSPLNSIKDGNLASDEIKGSISTDTPTQSTNDNCKFKPFAPSSLNSTIDTRKSKERIIRPDLIIRDLKTNIIVHVEIDEHKHRGYDMTNEEIRARTIADYFSSKGFKYKRLNFNPNGYENRIEMAHSFVDFVNCYKGICGVYAIDC